MSTQFGDGKRTLTTGDLVISVSEIFDRLQTQVDPKILDQLLRDIIAGRRKQVRPGELITAELINQILAEMESLESRVLKLELAGPGNGGSTETPATGFIEVRYIDSPRGIRLVPGDAAPFPNNFSVTNQTNRALAMKFAASVTGASGDWSKSIQITGPDGPVAVGATANFTVNVSVPGSAKVGEQAVLKVEATVGPPHNKLGQRELAVTIAESIGPPVTHSITFNQAQQPANTDNANTSTILPYVFDIRYFATQAPFSSAFRLTATLAAAPSDTLSDWFIDFSNVPTTNQSPGVITTPLNLDTNAATDTRINLRVRTPAQRSNSADKTATLTIRVESTDAQLTPPVTGTSGPFTIRVRRATP